MAKDPITCIEQMEKSYQELWEILIKDREEHWEQMAQMMEIIMKMSRGKGIADETGLVSTVARMQGVIEGPVYNPYHPSVHAMPEVSITYYPIIPMVNTLQDTCSPPLTPILSGGLYTYPYIPPLMVPNLPVTQAKMNRE